MMDTQLDKVYDIVPMAHRLPDDFLTRIADAVVMHGQDVQVKGRGPGSLESEETAGLDYRVVDGETIRDNLPWLWELYTSEEWVDIVSAAVGEQVKPSANVKSAININHLRGGGGRYELHVDGQPYSAVLQCNWADSATGGRLVMEAPNGSKYHIGFKPGQCVIFDGSKVPHAVEPLTASAPDRTSLPMVYVPVSVDERPEGLDDYLYSS